MTRRFCYLDAFGYMEGGGPVPPCHGKLIKAHLIPKQILRRCVHDPMDPRSWVWACGGLVGLGGHHGQFDTGMRGLRLRREAIPPGTEELARELGIEWWLDRSYGERAINP